MGQFNWSNIHAWNHKKRGEVWVAENLTLQERKMVENMPNLMKSINSQVPKKFTELQAQETWRKTTSRHIMTKLPKSRDGEKHLKNSQRKRNCYIQSNKGKDDSGFVPGNKTKKKLCDNIFKVLKEKKVCAPRILHLAKNIFEKERQMKTLSDIQKQKWFITRSPWLWEVLRGLLQAEGKACQMEIWIHAKEWSDRKW